MKRIILGAALGLGAVSAVMACEGNCGQPIAASSCGCAPVVVCPPCSCAPAPIGMVAGPTAVPFAAPTPAPPSSSEPPLAAPSATPLPAPPSSFVPPPNSVEPPPATLAAPTPASLKRSYSAPSFYDVYRVPARSASERLGGRGRVSFWNLSGREVVLKVGSVMKPLAHGRRVMLDLERSFQWQIDSRMPETAQVAPGDVGVELVIRR